VTGLVRKIAVKVTGILTRKAMAATSAIKVCGKIGGMNAMKNPNATARLHCGDLGSKTPRRQIRRRTASYTSACADDALRLSFLNILRGMKE